MHWYRIICDLEYSLQTIINRLNTTLFYGDLTCSTTDYITDKVKHVLIISEGYKHTHMWTAPDPGETDSLGIDYDSGQLQTSQWLLSQQKVTAAWIV